MRIACLVNNWLGWKCVEFVRARGDTVVAVALHPEFRRRYGEEIVEAAGVPPECIFAGDHLHDEGDLKALGDLGAEMAVSVLFGYLLRPACLSLFPQGAINLHPSYLPYNRGTYPNVWSIVDRTPAGVTLHQIDEGVDTGDIIAQREMAVLPTDTGETVYRRLETLGLELFKEQWPRIVRGEADRTPQADTGTTHRVRDIQGIDHIDLDKSYPARYLIDVLRARTFAPYPGAYFEENGRRVYLRLELLEEVDQPASATTETKEAA